MIEDAVPLPIAAVLPEMRDVLDRARSLVLQAPPGAGKTTRVPLALLGSPWLGEGRIVMLEPRRLAARAAARYMAGLLDEDVGATVGFRVRHETRVSGRTRVEVVTEGVLTRMLLADPGLEGVGLVLFDEFHERSLQADVGLALTLYTRDLLRPELRVVVMSATLDAAPVATLLNNAPVLSASGTGFPVETRYLGEVPVAGAVRQALSDDHGDILVFLPGAPEIRRAADALRDAPARIVPLYGNLPPEAQDLAIRPSPDGARKVVLATSIAETSLTIEGVRVVVDAGLARIPRYSPRTGMTRLATVRVSRASADQRRGRAGRLGPGVCYRLWSEQQDRALLPRAAPEILETDLAPLALDLAVAGAAPDQLRWLDPPPPAGFAEARSLLGQLGALDTEGRITGHGRAMSRVAVHPRLSHMVLKGRELGAGRTACELAALLSERDVLRQDAGVHDADIRLRLDLLRGTTHRADADAGALRRVRQEARECGRRSDAPAFEGSVDVGLLLALAYPDRVAQRRPGQPGRYLLANGTGATLNPQALTAEEYLVAAELDGKPKDARILRAAPVALDDLETHLAEAFRAEDVVQWSAQLAGVVAGRRVRLGALVVREAPLASPDADLVTEALFEGIRSMGLGVLPWSDSAQGIQQRVGFLRRLDPTWPDLSAPALAASLGTWLGPYVGGLRRLDELRRLDLRRILLDRLGREREQALEQLAPEHLTVPSGSRVAVDYSNPDAPVLAVRLQEVFGLTETPRVGGGRIPVTMHLLSPASRPVQVTRDLATFWRTTYFEVRKELKGRYPRHYWPEDPLSAEPTKRARPRGRPGNRG